MISGIYQILNTVNGLIYIGSAVNLQRRWMLHKSVLNRGKQANLYLQASWNKYGKDAFEFSVLEYVEDKTKLLEREQFWIDWTKSYNKEVGYNSRKLVNSNLGLKFSDETKKKMSDAGKNKNFIVTDEFRKKMSLIKTGVKMSDEARLNMSIGAKGKFISEETKVKMSISQKNRLRPANIGQLISAGKKRKADERFFNSIKLVVECQE